MQHSFTPLSYSLVMTIILSILSIKADAADFTEGNLKYTILQNYDPHRPENIVELTDGSQYTENDLTVPMTVEHNGKEYCVFSIGYRAFMFNTKLETIVLSEGIEEIGAEAFEGCSSLVFVKLPESLKIIGRSAFKGCWNIKDIILPNELKNINWGAFSGCSSIKYLSFPKQMNEVFTYELLANCFSLEEVVFPSDCYDSFVGDGPDVYRVAQYSWTFRNTFINCFRLRTITIGRDRYQHSPSLRFDNAFEGCDRLETLRLEGWNTIRFSESIDNLKSIEFLNSEDRSDDGEQRFNLLLDGCPSLEKIILSSEIPPTCEVLVCTEEQFQNVMVIVPDGAVEAYAQADGWSHFHTILSASDPTFVKTAKVMERGDDAHYYDLNGVRTDQPKKGVYIQNGKKIVVK